MKKISRYSSRAFGMVKVTIAVGLPTERCIAMKLIKLLDLGLLPLITEL